MLDKIFSCSEPTKEKYLYCKDDAMDILQIVSEIESVTGLTFMAKKADDEVNGAVITQVFGENVDCTTICGNHKPLGVKHTCAIIFLYAEDTPPKGRRKSTIKRKFKKADKVKLETKMKDLGFNLYGSSSK